MIVATWVVAWAVSASPARRLTVEEAVEQAMGDNPSIAAARARAEGSQAQANSARGRMLPGIHLSDEQQRYRDPFSIQFPLPGAPIAPTFVLRGLDTNTFVASAEQPLLGLLHLGAEHAAACAGAQAAAEAAKATEAEIKQQVQTAYLRLFEAKALKETSQASVRQLEEQRDVAQAQMNAGVLTRADVLRLETAVANARQKLVDASAQEQIVRATLLSLIGERLDDEGIDFVEPTSLEEGGSQALPESAERPELTSSRLQLEAASLRTRAKTFELLPEINAEAAYVRISGQLFAPPEEAYVGLKASWPIFEWGARWYARKAAAAQAQAAASEAEGTRRRIALEVRSRSQLHFAAQQAVAFAQAGIASAQEAYRVTEALVRAGSATTTDLIDAQSALTQAELNRVRSRYELAIARVAAMGALGR